MQAVEASRQALLYSSVSELDIGQGNGRDSHRANTLCIKEIRFSAGVHWVHLLKIV